MKTTRRERRFSVLSAISLVVLMASAPGAAAASDGGATPVSAGSPTAASAPPTVRPPPALSLPAQVGKHMFFDKSLSRSGKLACATCHDPAHAYGPPNGSAVQPGGHRLTDAGTRAVPSLRYQEYTPPYQDMLDNADGVGPPGPGGGYTADGR
ncbi:MAG TPA: cytochrome c peroxidase, partial [Steroidobacteraceae bacterium]|nr:cytochrome c peroxidase [Steroidobacteraceae bacterium]